MLLLILLLLQLQSSLRTPLSSVAVIDGHTYALGSKQVNWFQAVITCAAHNMQLPVISTPDDEKSLQKYMKKAVKSKKNGNVQYWLGATNLATTGLYAWFDTGLPMVTKHWNNKDNKANSSITWTPNGKWRQDNYKAKHRYICEIAPTSGQYGDY